MISDVLTKEQAKNMVIERTDNMVHTFTNLPSIGLLGSDQTRKSIIKAIDDSYMCSIAGEMAMGMGHGLAIFPKEKCLQSEVLFVETSPIENEKITSKDAEKEKEKVISQLLKGDING